jgi:PRTRC genetic system protein B
MNAHPDFGTERTFKLSAVICLYREQNIFNSSRETCAATIHEAATSNHKQVIGPGQPVTVEALESLAISLGRKLDSCLLPERVLSVSLARMAWWCPAGRRRIWFNPASKNEEGLVKLNGKVVAHPNLLFCAGGRRYGGLRVLAMADCARPTLQTKLFRAPYWNLDGDGHMCEGNVKMPDIISPSMVDKYEKAFFESSFSHSHWGHQITTHPKGHLGLWQEMVRAKSFPPKYLLPSKINLNTLLKAS